MKTNYPTNKQTYELVIVYSFDIVAFTFDERVASYSVRRCVVQYHVLATKVYPRRGWFWFWCSSCTAIFCGCGCPAALKHDARRAGIREYGEVGDRTHETIVYSNINILSSSVAGNWLMILLTYW